MGKKKKKIVSSKENYAAWYLDVVKEGDLYVNSPTAGCMTFLPKSVKIWREIQKYLVSEFEKIGVREIMLPILIPKNFIDREKEHVEGFAPELLTVTHCGEKELNEKYYLRPTSETMFCDFFKSQLNSWRDLPLIYNQWCNVIRWEKRPRPFLRTSEFHWQEGHTLHLTEEEARALTLKILNIYLKLSRELLAIEPIAGKKTEDEKFPGAIDTFTFEGMMSNNWALQMGTSHYLSQSFCKQFDLNFQDKNGEMVLPFYTSWGVSTRLLGAVFSAHSDDYGLVLPPKLAEYDATIIPLYNGENTEEINTYVDKIINTLLKDSNRVSVKGEELIEYSSSDIKYLVDYRDERMGTKLTDFERSGMPVRIVCGQKELENNQIMVVSRITNEKHLIDISELKELVYNLNIEGQDFLYNKNKSFIEENTVYCSDYKEIKKAVKGNKFALYQWDGDLRLAEKIKKDFSGTFRCLPFDGQFTDKLVLEKDSSKQLVIIARNF